MADCQECDGDGWLTPAFSASVIVNCSRCNADFSRGVGPVPDDEPPEEDAP